MAFEWSDDFREYNNALLGTAYDIVSPDFSDGSTVQATNSGRSGAGGVTFTPATDATGQNYPLYIGKQFTAQATRIVQLYCAQGGAQGTLGGRLVTFVDSPENVFGATVQVAINITSTNHLKAYRSTAANTGIILRNTDQGADSQMTLLGTSSNVLDGTDYLEIEVIHHSSAGEINVWLNNTVFWSLTGINTAISGNNSSTTVLWGGYAVQSVGSDTLHHEDLNAVISDLMVINGSVNASDPNDPTTRIGDHIPKLSLPTADSNYTQYTPDPSSSHFANVDEIPPDSDTSQNSAATTTLRDNFVMQDAAGTGSNQVYLTYKGFVKADSPATCTGTNTPTKFESFVWMESPADGTCITSTNDTSGCSLSDFVSRRAQSTCTIRQDGESFKFKANLLIQDGMSVCLSPLDTPPQVLNASGPSTYSLAIFNHLINTTSALGEVTYTLPFYQEYQGVAISTNSMLDSTGDFFEFKIPDVGTGIMVGLMDNANALTPFNPYTSTAASFQFAEEILGTPFYWANDGGFGYNGQSTATPMAGDNFRLTRNGGDIDLTVNGFAFATVTPGAMPTHLNPFVFVGKWGWDPVIPGYTIRPGIEQAFVQIAGSDCVIGNYQQLSCVTPASSINTGAVEAGHWGVEFDFFGPGPNADATILDPNNETSPTVPVFGFDLDTLMEFSLVGGNVVLTVTDWVSYADNMTTVVGNIATYVYTIPYANTDDFALVSPASGFPLGLPTFPFPSVAYALPNTAASTPLRLVVNCGGNSAAELPDHAGITASTVTFVDAGNPTAFTGFMRQSGTDRSGTTTTAPAGVYGYRESFLASTPAAAPITLADANAGDHGYTDPE